MEDYSTCENPAYNLRDRGVLIALHHAMPFLVKEVGISGFSATLSSQRGSFHGRIFRCGIPGYKMRSAQLGYGHQLSENASAGVAYHLRSISTRESPMELWSLSLSMGALLHIGKQNLVGLFLQSPVSLSNQNDYSSLEETAIHLGFRRALYARTWLYLETSLNVAGSSLKLTFQHSSKNDLHFFLGYCSKPTTYTLGVALPIRKTNVLLFLSFNPQIGSSPAIQINRGF